MPGESQGRGRGSLVGCRLWPSGVPRGPATSTGSLASQDGKVSAYNAGDLGSIPGLGRSPGEGNGNPLQYSCLENHMDRGAWWAIVHGVAKSQTQLKRLSSSSSSSSSYRITRGAPPPPEDPSPLRGTLGSSLRSPAEGEGLNCSQTYPSWFLYHFEGFRFTLRPYLCLLCSPA